MRITNVARKSTTAWIRMAMPGHIEHTASGWVSVLHAESIGGLLPALGWDGMEFTRVLYSDCQTTCSANGWPFF